MNLELEELAKKTHFPSSICHNTPFMANQEKVEKIAEHFEAIMKILGLDLSDPSLERTPHRVAKMYVNEIFSGLDPNTFPELRFVENEFKHQERGNMVFVKVNFTSFCEHHFLPMSGTVYAAYLPNKKIIGLSKIPRIVRFFSKRPQLQERLNAQIADSLAILLDTEHVAVAVHAKHYCMIARGIEDNSSQTISNVLRGDFDSNQDLRREFIESTKQ